MLFPSSLGSLLPILGLATLLSESASAVEVVLSSDSTVPQTVSLPLPRLAPQFDGRHSSRTRKVNKRATSSNCTTITSYANSVAPLQTFATFNRTESTIFRYRQQQSVNLGSWFVQESWMNPSLALCAGGKKTAELDVAKGYGGDLKSARFALEMHWDTWIAEKDFAYLQAIGINTVRLPIGFWSLGPDYIAGTPFESVSDVYANSWPRVVRAINLAAKYGLGVLVNLHGAPGSQSGHLNAGTSDEIAGLFASPTYLAQTITVLSFLTTQLVDVNNVVGIELLNEPMNAGTLATFYTSALETLRQLSPAAQAFPFYINDAFDKTRFANFVAARQDFLVLDHHYYFLSGSYLTESAITIATQVESTIASDLLASVQTSRGNLVVDEFACVLPSNALSSFATTAEKTAARATYCEAQRKTYANVTSGYSFWSYKTESCTTPDYCFKYNVGKALPSTFFTFPGNYPSQPLPGTSTASNPLTPPGILSPSSAISLQLNAIPLPYSDAVLANANATVKGYSDGFKLAKRFALASGSWLGFKTQYLVDSLYNSSTVSTAQQPAYFASFLLGLAACEIKVATLIAQQ